MANIPKQRLHVFVHQSRHLLRAEKNFRDTHLERHYQEFVRIRTILSKMLAEFDKLELEN